MSDIQLYFIGMVIAAFASFMITLGWVAVWSNGGRKAGASKPKSDAERTYSKAA